jgi:hypothetical protein
MMLQIRNNGSQAEGISTVLLAAANTLGQQYPI